MMWFLVVIGLNAQVYAGFASREHCEMARAFLTAPAICLPGR